MEKVLQLAGCSGGIGVTISYQSFAEQEGGDPEGGGVG